ncbi:MAG: MBOAT family O-acyltransferase [Fulvivirga sp.]
MLFNSIEFLVFLPITFVLYWFMLNKDLRLQNLLVVVASYIFYGWWDWRFLSLIFISSAVDYSIGRKLASVTKPKARKYLLWLSLALNLGFLGVFKYFNFFVDSLKDAFHVFGADIELTTLNIVLPVGISFYTFQTLSYTIDVYKGNLKPSDDPVEFFAFVSFFPQLVAGPIERATNLLGQFSEPRVFDYHKAKDGVRQIIWGFFKKIAIADTCAVFVNDIFGSYADQSSGMLLLGAFYFAFQIYGDFSGYSDIAIGTAKLFGFDLMTNFRYPYFSRDIAEFWRRWHISLSTWFRDYLYIPLGGSRGGRSSAVRNTFIIFIVSGFWHGANWTFIVWGALNAIYFLPLLLSNRNRRNLDNVANGSLWPSFGEVRQIIVTFLLTLLAWVFFRSPDISNSFEYLRILVFSGSWLVEFSYLSSVPMILIMVGLEWIQREKTHPMQIEKLSSIARLSVYCLIVFLTIAHVSSTNQEFIYFQF